VSIDERRRDSIEHKVNGRLMRGHVGQATCAAIVVPAYPTQWRQTTCGIDVRKGKGSVRVLTVAKAAPASVAGALQSDHAGA
jgi:hypothetical protein